ncbi:MAG: hypothetical protein A2W91_16370 [Bacteroidetes bacterium GWF2_38_335]|nr:MAG: hypothetical protein A2W91_16370 [Bacteroidetes bacterium GWF2_38_335]OFY81264.1 MAG: hypothetical protein A2281_07345 [Bacteroidetes bacterium RIFOXYA12_FULL_38_20]HBS85382.1 hypothetical protein [Bacteroidales bacterium]
MNLRFFKILFPGLLWIILNSCGGEQSEKNLEDLGLPEGKKKSMNMLKGAELKPFAGTYVFKDKNPNYNHFLRLEFADSIIKAEYMGCEMMNDSSVSYFLTPVFDLQITEGGDISFKLGERMLFFEPVRFNQKQFDNKFEISKDEIQYKGLITGNEMTLSCKSRKKCCWKETMNFIKESVDIELSEPTTATSFKKIVEVGTYASCGVYEIQNGYGEKIGLPEEVEYFLDCPPYIDIAPDFSYIVYGDLGEMKIYSFRTLESKTVMKFGKGCEGISGMVWSPNKNKMMFVEVNQKKLSAKTRIHVVDISMGSPRNREYFDVPVNFECGSLCGSAPDEDFKFKNNSTIIYKKHWASEIDPETEQIIELEKNK